MLILSIKKRSDFLKMRNNFEKKLSNDIFTIFISKAPNAIVQSLDKKNISFVRIGLVVTKKISRKAVVRNRIKRVVKESFRLTKDIFKNGYDYQFIVKKEVLNFEFSQIKDRMKEILN